MNETVTETTTLNMTVLYVDDVASAVQFYTSAFAMVVKETSAEYALLNAPGGGALALAHGKWMQGWTVAPATNLAAAKASVQLSFKVPCVTQAWARACAAGAHSLSAPTQQPWGHTTAVMQSPDGVLIEVCQPTSPR